METDKERSVCPLSRVLDLFGDKWSLLILRDAILFDKRRYSDFLASPERISTNILAARLRQLEAAGIVEKYADPADGKASLYIPTARGLRLLPLLVEAMRWGVEEFGHQEMPDFAIALMKDGPGSYIAHKNTALLQERKALTLAC